MPGRFSSLLRRQIPVAGGGDAPALAGLAVLVVVLFADVLVRGRVLYERDIHIVWHGQVESFVRCIASGSWPVWDPFLSFGQPLLANPGTQVLYPWTWLNLLAPPALVYTAYAVGHVALAGIGLYLLARRLGLSRPAAFVGGAVWIGSGPLLSMVSLWHHLAGAAWMPWVLLAADGVLRAPGLGRALLFGAALAGQILAGSADMCAMTGLLTAAYAVPFLRRREPSGAMAALWALAGTAFAACLAAALWIPVFENARRSARWDMPEALRTVWSVHPVNFLQVFLPLLPRDLPLTAAARKTLFDIPDPFLSSLYIGVPALALAAASFTRSVRPWVFGSVALAASLIAMGRHSWAYGMAVHLLPPLQILRYPSKAMAPAAFAGAVLCAYGFDAWRARDTVRPRQWAVLVGVPAAIGCLLTWSAAYLALHPWMWGLGVRENSPERDLGVALAPAARKLVVAGTLSTATAALALARAFWPRHQGATASGVAVLAVGGLLWAHRSLNPTAPGDFFRHRPPILDVLKRDGASRIFVFDYVRVTGRAYRSQVPVDIFSKGPSSPLEAASGLQAYLTPITGSRWGLYGSYDTDIYSLYLPQLKSLTLVLRASEETPLHTRLLQIGAVDHVVALHHEGLESLQPLATLPSPFAAPIRVFRVPGAWPRSYVVSGTRIADGPQAYRVLADPSFDPSREVILAQGREESGRGDPPGVSRILELRHDRVRLEAELRQPGYVVLSDTYDPGWKATVDGRSAPIQRANGAFRAVKVEAGRHFVEMVYRPASVVAGAALSAASLLVGGAAAARFLVGR